MRVNHPTRRRLVGLLAALSLPAAFIAGAGESADAAAPAAMTVVLHRVQVLPFDVCTARVGLDVTMSESDAQLFLDHPGEEATVKLWGDDQWFDNALISLPVDSPTWPQKWSGGYSVEFTRTFACDILDEDSQGQWGDYWDEIYAQVTFNDIRTGQTQTKNSNVIGYSF